MQKLMIDMDDVFVKGGFLYLINLYLGTNYKEEDFKKGYYMQSVIPPEEQAGFWAWFFAKNVYDYCEMLPNAYEVIEELNEFYKICIGTAFLYPERPRESGIILLYKYNYLLDRFPFLGPHNFAFLNDKSFLDCPVRIDDRMDNLIGADRKILFSAFHNMEIEESILKEENIERANDWLDVKKLLLKR